MFNPPKFYLITNIKPLHLKKYLKGLRLLKLNRVRVSYQFLFKHGSGLARKDNYLVDVEKDRFHDLKAALNELSREEKARILKHKEKFFFIYNFLLTNNDN